MKEISPTEECDAETMKKGMTPADAALLENGKFTLVGQGYWWNMLGGCQCAAHSSFTEARLQ